MGLVLHSVIFLKEDVMGIVFEFKELKSFHPFFKGRSLTNVCCSLLIHVQVA